MSYKLPTIDECTFTIKCEPEDTPVKGSFDSGIEEYDAEDEKNVIEQLNKGNMWAWCTVCVRAEYNGFYGEDYLGCVSCENEEDFISNQDYYDQMKQEAFDRLLENMKDTAKRLGCL